MEEFQTVMRGQLISEDLDSFTNSFLLKPENEEDNIYVSVT